MKNQQPDENGKSKYIVLELLVSQSPQKEKPIRYDQAPFMDRKIRIDAMVSTCFLLTLSWRRYLSYGNQSTNLQRKSMDWFVYDKDLRHERVKLKK